MPHLFPWTHIHRLRFQVAEATEAALREEEAKKDKLCQELNMLVQQSAHAQVISIARQFLPHQIHVSAESRE